MKRPFRETENYKICEWYNKAALVGGSGKHKQELYVEMKFELKLTEEELENISRPIISKKITTVIINLPENKIPGPVDFIGEFYQTLKEDLTPVLL